MRKLTNVHLLLYQGVSLLSRAIQWQTWSRWNHVALVLDDYKVLDAWKGGVRIIEHPNEGHSERTRIYLADVRLPEDVAAQINAVARAQEGKGYAYGQLVGFLRRHTPRAYRGHSCHTIDADNIKRFVCSGIIQYAFCRAGWPIVRKPWYKTDPSDIAESPVLRNQRPYEGDWYLRKSLWEAEQAEAK